MSRQDQIRAIYRQELDGRCPGCGRVGRRLGDHECSEPLSQAEALARIDFDGGLLKRPVGVEGPFDALDDLINVTGAFDRLADSFKAGTFAMQRLRNALAASMAPQTADLVTVGRGDLSYKALPVVEDPELPPDTYFAVTKPPAAIDFLRDDPRIPVDPDEWRRQFIADSYTAFLGSSRLGRITNITAT